MPDLNGTQARRQAGRQEKAAGRHAGRQRQAATCARGEAGRQARRQADSQPRRHTGR